MPVGSSGGAVVPRGIEIHKRDWLDIRRCEQPPIKDMEDMGLIGLIGDADPWTDLAFIVEALNGIASHSQIEGPVIVGAPLILNPELLARPYGRYGRG